jgi:hypothetical protein
MDVKNRLIKLTEILNVVWERHMGMNNVQIITTHVQEKIQTSHTTKDMNSVKLTQTNADTVFGRGETENVTQIKAHMV